MKRKNVRITGFLTLTKADGTQVVVRLASDGCDSMVYGSYSFYQAAGGEVGGNLGYVSGGKSGDCKVSRHL